MADDLDITVRDDLDHGRDNMTEEIASSDANNNPGIDQPDDTMAADAISQTTNVPEPEPQKRQKKAIISEGKMSCKRPPKHKWRC
jgi:hypothetical protein